MAQINKPSEHFNTALYTGNGGTTNVTTVGFQPDWVWIKARTSAVQGFVINHRLYNSIRGPLKAYSLSQVAEQTYTNGLSAFTSNGFTVTEGDIQQNTTNENYACWNWKAGGATPVSNTNGLTASTVSVNNASKFSIVNWTGTGANTTVGHGLGVVPALIIFRSQQLNNWTIYHKETGNTLINYLDRTTGSSASSTLLNNTSPTSSVIHLGSAYATNNTNFNCFAYCFGEVKGFSKFGLYTGNGSTDGTFIYTGFKPAFFWVKRRISSSLGYYFDNKRDPYNVNHHLLIANQITNEDTTTVPNACDFVSNGIKMRDGTDYYLNNSGVEYMYMAFAENPLVGTNDVPATAR